MYVSGLPTLTGYKFGGSRDPLRFKNLQKQVKELTESTALTIKVLLKDITQKHPDVRDAGDNNWPGVGHRCKVPMTSPRESGHAIATPYQYVGLTGILLQLWPCAELCLAPLLSQTPGLSGVAQPNLISRAHPP